MDEYRPNTQGLGAGFREAAADRFSRGKRREFYKKAGKRAIRGVAKGFGGAVLGTAALGAAVATGDPKNALTYTAAGVAAGSKLSGKVADRGMNEAIRTGSAFKKGVLGGDEYNARKTVAELRNDRDFAKACSAAGVKGSDQEKLARQFMENGITNKEDIIKAVVARKNYEKAHGVKRDGNGNIIEGNGIDDKQLIDLAVFNQGVGDYTWSDPAKRIKLLQGLYDRGISEEEVKKAELMISAMKAQ